MNVYVSEKRLDSIIACSTCLGGMCTATTNTTALMVSRSPSVSSSTCSGTSGRRTFLDKWQRFLRALSPNQCQSTGGSSKLWP